MTLKQYQQEVDAWAKQFATPYWEPEWILARLSEEQGELAREILHSFGPKKKKADEKPGNLEAEVGEMIFTLICLANKGQLDLDRAMRGAIDKAYNRDNNRYERK